MNTIGSRNYGYNSPNLFTDSNRKSSGKTELPFNPNINTAKSCKTVETTGTTNVNTEEAADPVGAYQQELERVLFSTRLNAQGRNELTKEQCGYLKEKYDVENLTEEEYHNLLNELKEMGIVSEEDIKNRFSRPVPPAVRDGKVIVFRSNSENHPSFDWDGKNYLSYHHNTMREFERDLLAIADRRASLKGSEIAEHRKYYEEQIDNENKWIDIFELLKRDNT